MKHKWNKTQIKALKSSILHWERMRDDKCRKMKGETEYPSGEHCACCKIQPRIKAGIIDCNRCPIRLFTGMSGCKATPYYEASEAYYYGDRVDTPQFKKASQKMINCMNKVLKAGIPEGESR